MKAEDDSDESIKILASVSSTTSFSADSLDGHDKDDCDGCSEIRLHCTQPSVEFPVVDSNLDNLLSAEEQRTESCEIDTKTDVDLGDSKNSFYSEVYSTCSEGSPDASPSNESNKKRIQRTSPMRRYEFEDGIGNFRKSKKTNRDQVTIIHFRSPLEGLESRRAKVLPSSARCAPTARMQNNDANTPRKPSTKPIKESKAKSTSPPPPTKTRTTSSRNASKQIKTPVHKVTNIKSRATDSGRNSPIECPAAEILARLYSRPDGSHKSLGVVTHSRTPNQRASENCKSNSKKGSGDQCAGANANKKSGSSRLTEIEVFMPKVSISSERVTMGCCHQNTVVRKPVLKSRTEEPQSSTKVRPRQKPVEVSSCSPKKLTAPQINEVLTSAIQELQKKVDELLPPARGQSVAISDILCYHSREPKRDDPAAVSGSSNKGIMKSRNVQGGAGDQNQCPQPQKNRVNASSTAAAATSSTSRGTKKPALANGRSGVQGKLKPPLNVRHEKLGEANTAEECAIKKTSVASCTSCSEQDRIWTKTYKEIHLNCSKPEGVKAHWNANQDERNKIRFSRNESSSSDVVRVRTVSTPFFVKSEEDVQEEKRKAGVTQLDPPTLSIEMNSLKAIRSRFSYNSPYGRGKATNSVNEEKVAPVAKSQKSNSHQRGTNGRRVASIGKQKPAWRGR